jgi:exosortase
MPSLAKGQDTMLVLREWMRRTSDRINIFDAAICLGLFAALFWANLRHFAYTWSTDENYSHGFLVPLISLYFAREAAKRGPLPLRSGVKLGVALVLIAIFGKLATVLVPVGIVADVSLLLGLAGLCSLLAGRVALRRFAFALFFLAFMVPLPVALYSTIASPLQIMVSRVASDLLNAAGIPVLCQGNMMTLPGGLNMFVAEACSGMRQLTGFIALTAVFAYLSRRPVWFRVIIVASSIPIAMTANVIRVMLTACIMYYINPSFASGSFHTIEGLLMMCLGLALLGGEYWVLSQMTPPVGTPDDQNAADVPVAVGPSRTLGIPGRVILAGSLLTTGLAVEAAVERASETSRPDLRRPLDTLPKEIGGWIGVDKPVEESVIAQAQATEYINRVYEDPAHPGRQFTVWMNYSKEGLNLRHSPKICLPGQGYTKVESQCRTMQVKMPDGASMPMTRLAYARGELVQRVGFWYYIFGEGSLEHFVRTLPITSRSSHGRTTRGSGLTIEVFCPGEFDPDGDTLRSFAAALLEALEPILPDDRAQYFIP